jgi:sigma-B regulation protein RsbU (phosphoserine phosphatase)
LVATGQDRLDELPRLREESFSFLTGIQPYSLGLEFLAAELARAYWRLGVDLHTGTEDGASCGMTTVLRDEQARLASVRRFDALELSRDGAFDRVAAIAARVLDAPISLVSLVEEDRIFFLSHLGTTATEMTRDAGLCASAVLQDDITVIPDAHLDPLAVANPLVAGEMGLRFYAAAPIRTSDGHNLGTVCVLDFEPRNVSRSDVAVLEDLAALVAQELEVRLAARQLVIGEVELRQAAAARARDYEGVADALRAALIPQRLPSIPGMEIAATYRPAARSIVGGDFYDVFPLGPAAWGVAVGDVCGKGLPVATITAAARHALRGAAVEHSSPADALAVVNSSLIAEFGQGPESEPAFCTAIYGRLRRRGHGFQIMVAAGGHPPGLIRTAEGQVKEVGGRGPLIGAFDHSMYRNQSMRLEPGDALIFFTDGVTEAPTATGLLGLDGLKAIIRQAEPSARGIIGEIETSLAEECRGQRDDVAVVVARVEPG